MGALRSGAKRGRGYRYFEMPTSLSAICVRICDICVHRIKRHIYVRTEMWERAMAKWRDSASLLPLATVAISLNLTYISATETNNLVIGSFPKKKSYKVFIHSSCMLRFPPVLAGWWNMFIGDIETSKIFFVNDCMWLQEISAWPCLAVS